MVDLEQETVASLLVDGSLDAERVGDGQVVADNLDRGVRDEAGPLIPVILIEGVFDGDDGVLLDVAAVEVGKLLASDLVRAFLVGVLEVEVVVLAVVGLLVEFGGGDVESDLDFTLVSGLFDGLDEKFERLLGTGDVWCEASLVTNVGSWGGGKRFVSPRVGLTHTSRTYHQCRTSC